MTFIELQSQEMKRQSGNTVKLAILSTYAENDGQNPFLYIMHQSVNRPKQKAANVTHRESCALLNSVQEFTKIEAWLLLTFSLCLQNQFSYILPVT